MKKVFSLFITIAIVLTALMSVSAIDATPIPDIPEGKYALKDTALQLTSDITSGVTSTAKSAVRIVPAMKEATLDISGKQYLYVWIYVSDETMLYDNNGDSIELCSGGNRDTEESAIYFYYDKEFVPTVGFDYAPLDRGWNEYLLKLDDFMVDKGGALNPAALNYIGIVMRSNPEGLTFAVSKMYAVNLEDLTYDPSVVDPTGTTAAPATDAPLPELTTAAPVTDAPTEAPAVTTAAPATEAATTAAQTDKKPEQTTAPEQTGGCGSSVAGIAALFALIPAGAVMLKKKKNRNA